MQKRVPRSYDEITRKTVPDPDSSWRPSQEQEREAYEGYRHLDAQEQELFDRVDEALSTSGHDLHAVTIEIDRDRVIVRGTVMNHDALAHTIDLVRGVEGVGEVVDRLVLAGS